MFIAITANGLREIVLQDRDLPLLLAAWLTDQHARDRVHAPAPDAIAPYAALFAISSRSDPEFVVWSRQI
jgi:hypothetical protein